jgi:L-ascorbate metabolism protein UlaG (beta-lactamase superfamily)
MQFMLVSLLIIVGIIVLGYLFLNYYPAFGAKSSQERLQRIRQSANFSEGKFMNQIPTSMKLSVKENLLLIIEFMKGNPRGKPDQPLAVEAFRILPPEEKSQVSVTWLGHSASLLEMNGKVLFLDPMLGPSPSPFPLIGGKRFSKPIDLDHLPSIDAVFLSHDHYDHLDYGSIQKLKAKVRQFFVPLGVGAHLERWGVSRTKIKEFDWWEEFEFEGFTLASTPARHFSGRSLADRDSTLWCSWVIADGQTRVFYSGDSGYGPHFEEIGRTYGPFDLTLMECGQYDERWSALHMVPEETVQAHLDVQGKIMIPVHWGAFTLAMHDWIDPIERVVKAARERNAAIATPRIGETVFLRNSDYPSSVWWR